jgi:nucleolar protein 58
MVSQLEMKNCDLTLYSWLSDFMLHSIINLKYGANDYCFFLQALVGQASTKNKGKISRSLAAKASLATRVDAFGEEATFDLGTDHRARLETRLRILEDGNLKKLSGTGKVKAKFEKYQATSEIKLYPTEDDNTIPIVMEKKRKLSEGKSLIEEIKNEDEAGESSQPPKKKKKKNKQEKSEESQDADETIEEAPKKKKKKSKGDESMILDEPEIIVEPPKSDKKKKKKKSILADDE